MERKGELLYQRFLNTAQETVRLTAALDTPASCAISFIVIWGSLLCSGGG